MRKTKPENFDNEYEYIQAKKREKKDTKQKADKRKQKRNWN